MWSSKEDPLLAPSFEGDSRGRRPPPRVSNDDDDAIVPPQSLQHRLDVEEAETSTLNSILRRTSLMKPNTTTPGAGLLLPKPKLLSIAMRAKSMQQLNALRTNNITNNTNNAPISTSMTGGHARSASRAQDLLQNISNLDDSVPSQQHKGLLLSHVDDKADINQTIYTANSSEGDNDDDYDDEDGEYDEIMGSGNETLPFLEGESRRYGSVAQAISQVRRHRRKQKQFKCTRLWRKCVATVHPYNLARLLGQALMHSYFVWFGLPLTGLAWFLYYELGNPELDFLPGTATLAWWINFAARQLVTLDLARWLQWLLLDCLILGRKWVSRWLGPVVSLYCIQAKGWPVVLTNWACLDLVFLHGDSAFCSHWLYWTGIHIYSITHANSGTYILNSSMYLRALLALLLAGFATTLKRFWLSFQFSRRQCLEFKPKLEKILVEMILVSEVASFADQAAAAVRHANTTTETTSTATTDAALTADTNPMTTSEAIADGTSMRSTDKDVGIQSVGFEISKGNVDFDDGEDEEPVEGASQGGNGCHPSMTATRSLAYDVSMAGASSSTLEMSSRHLRVKYLLDSWEPPVDKSEKTEVSVRDVLLFQAALMYMNDDKPFGEAFGPASTRDECIESSTTVYADLQSLDDSSTTDNAAAVQRSPLLDFDVLALATCNEDGTVDMDKKKMLRRLFRPDAGGQISELAFIQSCDAIFKRLCFFRASVGNSSVIDKVLASIFDWFYYFTLTCILLSLLHFNPWALMVSLTSLLVSASFALGSSLSRYVEGILLIAVTRPYDLGDRIYIGTADTIATSGTTVDVSSHTWFVEDITLTTTTLRFARTNEVSILHNWAIIGSKIINCNRSPGATILLDIKLHISILQGTNLMGFEEALRKYVETHPRVWDSLVFCRHDSIDADNEQVTFALGFRHRNSWQDAGRIKLNRADLVRYVYELAEQLKINYETPPPRRLMYHAGDLANGEVESYKTDLLKAGNVKKHAGEASNTKSIPPPLATDDAKSFSAEEEDVTVPLLQGG